MPYRFPLLLGSGALSAACLLSAQPAREAPVPLARVDVTADRIPSLTAPGFAATAADLAGTPGGVEAFSADRYLRGRASTVEDTFALSPGLIAQSRFGSDEARLSIRGSGLQRTFHGRGLRLLQDGVPLNLADGSFDMQAMEPLAAEYVVVRRGGSALAAGASTLGGSIDLVSRTGRTSPGGFARLEAGSWDYRRLAAGAGDTWSRWDGYATVVQQSQDGFREHARQENLRFFGNGAYRIHPQLETRVYLTGVHSRSELPGSLTWGQLVANSRQAAPGNLSLDQRRDFELLRVASKTTGCLPGGTWELVAAWSDKDLDHPIFQWIEQVTEDALLGGSVTWGNVGENRQPLVHAGLLFTHGTAGTTNFVNAGGRRGARITAVDQTATNVELAAEARLPLTRQWTAVVGLTAVRSDREAATRFGSAPSYQLAYERLLPKIALRWDGEGQQAFVAYAGSVEPPSFSEAVTANTARRAQRAQTVEAGYRGQADRLHWDVTVYHCALRNELLALDHDNEPGTPAVTVNADRTTHSGVEAGLEVSLLPEPTTGRGDLMLRTAWTYGRFRFDDDPRYGNNTLAGLPEHVVRAELMWEAGSWYFGPVAEWVPQPTLIDFRNTVSAEAYWMCGFRCGRRSAQGWSWFIDARNLGDTAYAATTGVIEDAGGVDQPQFLPGDGRSVFGGVEFRW